MLYRPDPEPGKPGRKFYVDVLKSDACQCERSKQPRRAVCYKCWLRLPDELRRPLYQRIGQGFEHAYDTACKYLNQ